MCQRRSPCSNCPACSNCRRRSSRIPGSSWMMRHKRSYSLRSFRLHNKHMTRHSRNRSPLSWRLARCPTLSRTLAGQRTSCQMRTGPAHKSKHFDRTWFFSPSNEADLSEYSFCRQQRATVRCALLSAMADPQLDRASPRVEQVDRLIKAQVVDVTQRQTDRSGQSQNCGIKQTRLIPQSIAPKRIAINRRGPACSALPRAMQSLQ